jgi:hypothetical protein
LQREKIMADRNTLNPEEEAVTDIQATEQDREETRLDQGPLPPGEPGIPGPREEVDRDDSETSASSSRPLI